MTGTVDPNGRALLRVFLRHPASLKERELEVWIDTAFTGDLVLPRKEVISMALPLRTMAKAILADGSEHQVETFDCLIQWSGQWTLIEVIANDTHFPLLGVGLLRDHELTINYPQNLIFLT